VESRKATSARAFAGNNHDPALFSASAEAEPGQLEAARDALLQTLEDLSTQPFEKDEIEKAKVRSKRMAEQLHANSSGMAQALSSAPSRGAWRPLFLQRARVQAVTADDVNRVARTYLKRPNRTVGLYVPVDKPERLAIAAAPSLESLVKDYKGG